MKKTLYFLGILLIIGLSIFSNNVYAADYPSVDDLSDEEKEFLPYYDFGWTYIKKNSTSSDIYYLGKKVKTITTKLDINGKTYYETGNYNNNFKSCDNKDSNYNAITNAHQLFMVMDDNSYYGKNKYIVRYDLDTDEYKAINSVEVINSKYGDIKYIESNGTDAYILCTGGSNICNVLKYSPEEDTFVYLSTLNVDITRTTRYIIYDTKNKVWVTETSVKYCLVTMDFENGTSSTEEQCTGSGLTVGTQFSLWQRQSGIVYYWQKASEKESEYKDTVLYYNQLRKYNANTGEDTLLFQVRSDYGNDLEFITPQGISVDYADSNSYRLIYNEIKRTAKWNSDIIGNEYSDSFDMWNYYYKAVAYPIWEPMATEITEVKDNQYSDRITINWKAVNGATGYNIYVDGQKVNTTPITDTTYVLKNLDKDTSYTINITALNDVGESEKSTSISAKTGNMMIGDVDGNGKINIGDAQRVMHYCAGKKSVISEERLTSADIDGNGKVNIADAMRLMHYCAGKKNALDVN
jgi:hypothetical protein